jgi:hypothetical protein
VRADFVCHGTTKYGNLLLHVSAMEFWSIPPDATNDYYLSATFSPTTNHPSALKYPLWQGTLNLPKVKISIKKP